MRDKTKTCPWCLRPAGTKSGTRRMQLAAIKKVGAMGRVVIPADIRKTRGLESGTEVGIYVDGDRTIIRALDRRPEGRTHRRPSDG